MPVDTISSPYYSDTKIIYKLEKPNFFYIYIKINIYARYKGLSRNEKHIIRQ
jgi:hypothetical protein